MANTTNLNLGKLSGSEKLKTFPTMQAGNMDAIDSAFGSGFGVGTASDVNSELNSLGDGLAIIANGNTHAAITSGQFVYVRKHNTLTDGLYTANSNISANATLSSSNLTADTVGGLNSVYSTLNSNINNKFRYFNGFETCTFTLADQAIATGINTFNVTFDHELSNIPSFILCMMPQTSVWFVSAYSITKTGATVRMYAESSFTTTSLVVRCLTIY